MPAYPVILALDVYENPFSGWSGNGRSDIPLDALPRSLHEGVDKVTEPDGGSCTGCEASVGLVTYDTSNGGMSARWNPVRIVVDLNYRGQVGTIRYFCEACAPDDLLKPKGD